MLSDSGLCNYQWRYVTRYYPRNIRPICLNGLNIYSIKLCKCLVSYHTYCTSDVDIMRRSLQWCHSKCDSASNHRCRDCSFTRLFRRRSKKASKLRVTCLCEGNPSVTGGFPFQGASNAEIFPFDSVIMWNVGVRTVEACVRLISPLMEDSYLAYTSLYKYLTNTV